MSTSISIVRRLVVVVAAAMLPTAAWAGPLVVDPSLHHLRSGDRREWADFPAQPEGAKRTVTFTATKNTGAMCLRWRQQDVRLLWRIVLNGKELGRLRQDENDTIEFFAIPAGRLVDGDNTLTIESPAIVPDDIRVGEIQLFDRPMADVLGESTVEITVNESESPVPCRITVLNDAGALMTTGSASTDQLAVRPGVIYSADGRARFGLPAGDYTIHAGRGFEYGIATARISLRAGETLRKALTIRREVPTQGYVACDPHVHTLTFSGHGDCKASERVVTLAGEGIELPIVTEHNKQSDYRTLATRAGVQHRFTMVTGNEVTTAVGHFNVFPLDATIAVPDHRATDWKSVAAALGPAASPRVVILNHARDIHLKFRPFDPARHIALTGEDLEGWELPANAMEVVNSGAQLADPTRLVRDWLGLLNRGHRITPVGSSDSHDVSRYIVGQGRTYIRCKDDKPAAIDVADAVRAFTAGEVMVSCGLLTEITVNNEHGPGQFVPGKDDLSVKVRVLGPAWAKADKIELYANGILLREADIVDSGKAGEKWAREWIIPRPKHDIHLVAMATGPGVEALYWPFAKPYQATSPVVRKRNLGLTGAVRVDGDGDGKWTSAFEYARQVLAGNDGKRREAIAALADYDEAVASQAAGILRKRGISLTDQDIRAAAKAAGPSVLRGFDAYAEAWRESQTARP